MSDSSRPPRQSYGIRRGIVKVVFAIVAAGIGGGGVAGLEAAGITDFDGDDQCQVDDD